MTSLFVACVVMSGSDLARVQGWNGDSSVFIAVDERGSWGRNLELEKQLGTPLVYESEEGDRVLFTYFADAKEVGFESKIEANHAVLLRALKNKSVVEVKRKFEKLGSGALDYRAYAYPNFRKREALSESACDAVGLHVKTEGGMWTLSMNGAMGSVDEIWGRMGEFMDGVEFRSMNGLAKVKE